MLQVVERAECSWMSHPARKLLTDRTAFTSGDFFKPGQLQPLHPSLKKIPDICTGFHNSPGILRDWPSDFRERGLKRGTTRRIELRPHCFWHISGHSPKIFWLFWLSFGGHPHSPFTHLLSNPVPLQLIGPVRHIHVGALRGEL